MRKELAVVAISLLGREQQTEGWSREKKFEPVRKREKERVDGRPG
jgi:hypothetical protein